MKPETLENVKIMLDYARRNDTFFLTTKEFNEFENEVLEYCDSPLPSAIINSLEHSCEYMEYDLLQSNDLDVDAVIKGYKAAIEDIEKLLK
jgi:hypothetical protein